MDHGIGRERIGRGRSGQQQLAALARKVTPHRLCPPLSSSAPSASTSSSPCVEVVAVLASRAGGVARTPKPVLRARFASFNAAARLSNSLATRCDASPAWTRKQERTLLFVSRTFSAARQALLATPHAPGVQSTLDQFRDPAPPAANV